MIRLLSYFLLFLFTQTQPLDQKKLTGQASNPKNLLEKETQEAFNLMKKAAAKDGIHMAVVSGYRSFTRQTQIWNHKYKKYAAQGLEPDTIFDKIVEYSTVPGTSRHHWGTDIDLIDTNATYSGDVLVPSKFHGTGPFCKLKDWMEKHGSTYNFELVYTMNNTRTGFKYEPWHYSYVPLSRKRYNDYVKTIDLVPFLRSETVMGTDKVNEKRIQRYMEEHIKGINSKLKGLF